MKILITCFTSDFDIMRLKWRLKKQGLGIPPDLKKRYDSQTGSILVYDWDETKEIAQSEQSCPFGIYAHGDSFFVCDAKENVVKVYDQANLGLKEEIRSPFFNDVHSIVKEGKDLVVTSTGLDAVLKINPETYAVSPVLAFHRTEGTKELAIDKEIFNKRTDFSLKHIPTEDQATHLNYAATLPDGRLGISLFHQGEIIAINKGKGYTYETMIRGLTRSHSFFTYNSRFFVADSGASAVKVYDSKSFELQKTLQFKGWVQDIKKLTMKTGGKSIPVMSVADADNAELFFYNLDDMSLIKTIKLNTRYRISSCEIID